ncbi:MAG: superoxide dismutase family protein [Hyphomonas sp.]|nr:superoxide dismutase family protein [Hyphomonas sp.]
MIRKALLAASLPLVACAHAPAQDEPPSLPTASELPGPEAGVFPSMLRMGGDIVGADGRVIGALNILDGPNGVMLEATIEPGGLTPGWHGLHLHQVGDCSDTGTFKLSGGHVGKIENGHGLLNPKGPEAGDVPNVWAAADGSAGYEAFTTLISGAELADEDGTALIIHQNRDDHMTQPIGGAGPRVACAVIK